MENYERISKVGEGTYGVVYMARHRPSGLVCAMKKIRLHAGAGAPDDEEGVPATAIREISCLRELHAPLAASPASSSASSASSDDEDEPRAGSSENRRLSKEGAQHVVKLFDVLHDDHRMHLVFEYVDSDLRKYMDRMLGTRAARQAAKQAKLSMVGLGITGLGVAFGEGEEEPEDWEGAGLPAAQVKSLTHQLVLGLAALHSRRILHRDLKPQNLLIDPHGALGGGPLLKIADFGLARTFGVPVRTYTHEIITLYYRPPEVLLGGRHYTTAVDMWSVGCIMAEMATGKPIFCGDSELGQIMKIFQALGTPDSTCWPSLPSLPDYNPHFPQFRGQDLRAVCPELPFAGLDLLAGCVIYNPALRASAKDALTHPYLRFGPRRAVRRRPAPQPHQDQVHSPTSPLPCGYGHACGHVVKKQLCRVKDGCYPTPPMSTRPRAPSKLGLSPMTMPVSYVDQEPGASTYQPGPAPSEAALADFSPSLRSDMSVGSSGSDSDTPAAPMILSPVKHVQSHSGGPGGMSPGQAAFRDALMASPSFAYGSKPGSAAGSSMFEKQLMASPIV